MDVKHIEAAGYEITRYGDVLKLNGLPFKPRLTHDGYDVVSLRLGGKSLQYLKHRLVAAKYCNKPDGCEFVNHKDGDKLNCDADNLEWVTQSQNLLHAHGSTAYGASSGYLVEEAKRLRGEGMSLHSIASILGTSYVSVWRWLKK